MWGATFPTDASVDGMVEADRRSYDGWSDLIRLGQDEGSIRPDLDPGATAVMLLGFMRGVAALLCTDAAVTDMHGVRRTCDTVITATRSHRRPALDRRGTPTAMQRARQPTRWS